MRLPRWTVYPALAVLGVALVSAVPRRHEADPFAGAARASDPTPLAAAPARAPEPAHRRLVVFGIDGMDPDLLAEALALYPERMPNFRWLVAQAGEIRSLRTSTPPQSPVAWSNFITGLDPGGHGIFDFIHRDPVTRAPAPSTTKVEDVMQIPVPGKWQIPFGGASAGNRSGVSFWEILRQNGVPADIWRMPANFPVEPSSGVSFPDMMTPALDSAYGECTFYTTDPIRHAALDYSKAELVREYDGVIETAIRGPANPFVEGDPHVNANLSVLIDHEQGAAAIEVGSQVVVLEPGEWSDFVHLEFKMLPMGMNTMSGICRFYLRSIEPEVELYVSPVNIDPTAPATPVSEPHEASVELAEAIGDYYTQGMAEDVNALKFGVLTDAEFMQQVDLVYRERRSMFDYALDRYAQSSEGGFLFFYFSTVDLACHMMWRHFDATHPAHDQELARQDSSSWSGRPGSTWRDTIHELYVKMDPALGQVRAKLGDDVPLIVMSDHGFATFKREFHLNTWLVQNGYLVLKDGQAPESGPNPPQHEQVHIFDGSVDWSRTRAYGIGFNGLYLNLAGRELDDPASAEDESGIVRAEQAAALLAEIKGKLEALVDDQSGVKPVLRCDLAQEIYRGARVGEAPDLLVGYNAGYGNSDASTTGRIPHCVLEDNHGRTFYGNHLMAPDVVAGMLLSNQKVRDGDHGLEDLTVEILGYYGLPPGEGMRGHRVLE